MPETSLDGYLDGYEPLLDINQVRAIFGVSRRTIYNWMAAGKVDWVTTPSGSRRIVTASLARAVITSEVPQGSGTLP
jgi:predicted site-specific integrase-resolvase